MNAISEVLLVHRHQFLALVELRATIIMLINTSVNSLSQKIFTLEDMSFTYTASSVCVSSLPQVSLDFMDSIWKTHSANWEEISPQSFSFGANVFTLSRRFISKLDSLSPPENGETCYGLRMRWDRPKMRNCCSILKV